MISPIDRLNKQAPFFPAILCVAILCIEFSCQSTPNRSLGQSLHDTTNLVLPAPKALSPSEFSRIKSACEKWYDTTLVSGNFNGGMLVAKNGNIIFEKYSGTGHIGLQDTITAITSTQLASVSKTFTAMAVLKLVQDGKIRLDELYEKYIPGFNYPGITIRELLNHRSGLPNYLYFMEDLGWDKHQFMSNQDVYDHLVNQQASLINITKPGTHFCYCNTNYVLLALLIEKVSGKNYPQFMKETFFDPLHMNNSFVYTDADSDRVNPSYDWRGNMIPRNSLDKVYGDKNIYSTPRDLLKWDRALSANVIFKPEILAQAYTPYSNEKPGVRNYGLGWRLNVYPDGKKLVYHNGWWHGNNAVFIRMLDEDATIIVMGNKFSRGIYKAKNLVSIFNLDLKAETEEEAAHKEPK